LSLDVWTPSSTDPLGDRGAFKRNLADLVGNVLIIDVNQIAAERISLRPRRRPLFKSPRITSAACSCVPKPVPLVELIPKRIADLWKMPGCFVPLRPTGTPIRPYADSVTSPDTSALLPELHNTIVVAAFEGWNDAGDAASDALEHLDAIWEADPIVEIDDEAYYDYQVNRPVIRQVDGVTRELVWPSMRISHCRPPGADRDIVLMHGVEPNMRWRTFCAELLAVADKLNVDTVVILGALLADTPHTRPVPVSGAAYSPESARRFGLQETRYEGPTGIAGVFQDACVAAGIPAVTFWAAVPHYVSQPPNPKATVALLRRVEDVLDIEVPLADLPAQAEEWEQAVTEMTAEDDEVSEYVQSLEQRGDAEVDMNEALGKIDGDALAAEFERYLRRRRPGFGR
jgi:predicted ATP-grasp superfamily ATP-dependent carboligase